MPKNLHFRQHKPSSLKRVLKTEEYFINIKVEKANLVNKHILFEYMKYDYRVRSMIYTTNWIERLNKTFRKTLKVRGALPSVDSVLVLITKTAIDMGEGTYHYPIHNFKNV